MAPWLLWSSCGLLGMIAGIVGATLGVGSGIIMVPALVLLFHYPQKAAQGISLAVMVFMTFTASLRYWADPATRMDLRMVAMISLFAVPGALVGAGLARSLPVAVLQKAFAVLLVAVAVRLAFFSGDKTKDGGQNAAATTGQNEPGAGGGQH